MKRILIANMVIIFALALSGCAGAATTVPPTAEQAAAATAVPPTVALNTPTAIPVVGMVATVLPKDGKQYVIGFSGAQLLDEFQISLDKGIEEKAAELGVKVIHIENNNDPVKQTSDIEDLLAQNVDMLIIEAASADAIVPSIQKANEMGVPVMTVDQGSNGGKFISHNGNDNYCMGYRGMENVINMIGGKGKVMHITGIPGTMIVGWNADAVKSVVSKYPGITLVNQSFAKWDAGLAQTDTEDVLTANPDLAGIYVHSEVMTPGVLAALKAHNLLGKVVVISGGWAPESQQNLADNSIQGAIEWDSHGGGQKTMQSAYDYLVKGTVPPKWNPWTVYINLQGGKKETLDCPIQGWSPFAN